MYKRQTPVTIEELIAKGFLVPLRSKLPRTVLETSGLHKRGGEFIASEMEEAFNTEDNNSAVVSEIIEKASDRNHWLIFCAGIAHSEAVSAEFVRLGITSASLSSKATKGEREAILADFESGKIRALCNVGILTTGYDFPALDCIAFLRATASPGLYLQMAVRGCRIYPEKRDCLVLDFAGLVSMHGPITNVTTPKKKGDGGDALVKVCDACGELVHISVMICPACGEDFPPPKESPMKLSNDDIMGIEGMDMDVTSWSWRQHISKASGNAMLAVSFYGGLSDPPVTEYLSILNPGYAGQKSQQLLFSMALSAGVSLADMDSPDLDEVSARMNAGTPPAVLEYNKDGRFYRVLTRSWSN